MNLHCKKIRQIGLRVAFGCALVAVGHYTTNAQTADDPFRTRPWEAKKNAKPTSGSPASSAPTTSASSIPSGIATSSGATPSSSVKPVKASVPVVKMDLPPLQARLDQYKMIRRVCAEKSLPCPKLTAYLSIDEFDIIGIFRTKRGFSAMVQTKEMTPALSQVIYPGDKFFNGQLVAVEENRLVFRRINRMTDGRTTIVAESKPLRQEVFDQFEARTVTAAVASNSASSGDGSSDPNNSGVVTEAKPEGANKVAAKSEASAPESRLVTPPSEVTTLAEIPAPVKASKTNKNSKGKKGVTVEVAKNAPESNTNQLEPMTMPEEVPAAPATTETEKKAPKQVKSKRSKRVNR